MEDEIDLGDSTLKVEDLFFRCHPLAWDQMDHDDEGWSKGM